AAVDRHAEEPRDRGPLPEGIRAGCVAIRSGRRTDRAPQGAGRERGAMIQLVLVWLINALALIAVAYLMPGVSVASFTTALVAALVLGLVNAVVRPVLFLLTLPVTVLTLG